MERSHIGPYIALSILGSEWIEVMVTLSVIYAHMLACSTHKHINLLI